MINIQDIYEKTDSGLDIIAHYYPTARDVSDTKKHFKRRPEENHASACIKKFNTQDGQVYKVTDFGDTQTAMSPIDVCMAEENLSFKEAVNLLASRYGVGDNYIKSANVPKIRKVPATADQKEGTRFFSCKEFTTAELEILGPRVTEDTCKALNWHSLEYVADVRDRHVTYKYSTDTYPIFMRECIVPADGHNEERKFFKYYEPLNYEKQYRFLYSPKGERPRLYINGFEELKAVYRDYNAQLEKDFYNDPANAEKPFTESKLPEAVICSGERDSLCVKSLGYQPIWFNSESYRLSEKEYKDVMKYVEVLYNIPDLDATGIKKGTELALNYIDIHTIWLPKILLTYKDSRGKSKKDFRDYCDLRDKTTDFRNLLTLAMPARFWTETITKVRETKQYKKSYDIDSECLSHFLKLNGFVTLRDENLSSAKHIRVVGNIVKLIQPKDIRRFVMGWAYDRFLNREIRNLIKNSAKLSDAALENLDEVDLDFTNYTPTTQLFFCKNKTYEATGKGIIEHPAGATSLDRYVWAENVIPHEVKLQDDYFEVKRYVDDDGSTAFDIEIKEVKSNFMGYIINSSRLYWRREMEFRQEGATSDELSEYKKKHKFSIDGPMLEEAEVLEQKKNLINKIFVIGYLLHRYKSPSRAWAPQAMDNKIGEDGECNGRSGKSFMFKTLSYFMKSIKLSGRNPKLMDNPHVFERINQHTELLLIDDCDRYLNTGLFYDNITSDMTINPKNNQSFTIPFEDSPKLAFTTNYVPYDFDPSSEARLLYTVFSDYYHEKTINNDYLETRSIRDDFGGDLFSKMYTKSQWDADINFLLQCCKFYLSICQEPIKLLPPMDKIIYRKYKADMGSNFEDWANSYFSEDGDHLDKFISRADAFTAYKMFSGVTKTTMQKFTKQLIAFCVTTPYIEELNPKEYQNGQGRIVRKVDDKSCDMIYVKSYNSDSITNPPVIIDERGNITPF